MLITCFVLAATTVSYDISLIRRTQAMLPSDVDVGIVSVTPATPTYPVVYVYYGSMRIGNGNPSLAVFNYFVLVKRNDNNIDVPSLMLTVSLVRSNALYDPPDTIVSASTFTLIPEEQKMIQLIWSEDGTMPATPTGVTWRISVRADVVDADATDTNLDNNVQAAGTLVAKTLTGDVTGNGFVDIFDAIRLANLWGTGNAEADLNGNGVVDIFDAILLSNNFYKHVP